MSFNINGASLAIAINVATKIVGKAPEYFVLSGRAKTNTLIIRGISQGRYVRHEFKANRVNDDFKFGVPVDRLVAIASKRAALDFRITNKNATLEYHAVVGNYKGYIETVKYPDMDIPKLDDAQLATITIQLKTALFKMFSAVALVPQFVTQDMFLFIGIDEKGFIKTASADSFHIGLLETLHPVKEKENTEKIKIQNISLPFPYVSLITNSFDIKESNLKLSYTKSHIHVFDENTTVSLPLISPPKDGPDMQMIINRIEKSFKSEPIANFKVDINEIKLALNNMSGIKDIENNSDLSLKVAGNLLQMDMRSKHGAVSDSVNIENYGGSKSSISLEPGIVQDVLDRVEGNCRIMFLENNLCLLERSNKDERVRYLIVTTSPQKK